MKPRAIMMSDSLWDSLQEEAKNTGMDTGEHIREILRDHLNADSETDVITRIDELEDRIDCLEREENKEVDSVVQEEQSKTKQDSTSGAEISETQTVDSQEGTTETTDDVDQSTSPAVDEFGEEYADYIEEALNNTSVLREGSNSKKRKRRRVTAAAALEAAVNTDEALGRRELIDRFYDDDRYSSEDYFWKQDIRPVLQEVGNYDYGESGYVFPDLSHDSEDVGHLEGDQSEKSDSVVQEEQSTVGQNPTTDEGTSGPQTIDGEDDTTETIGDVDQPNPPVVDDSSQEYADFIKKAVNDVIASRGDRDSEQLRMRRATAAAVLEAAVDAKEALGRRELVDRFYDDDRYTSRDSFWRSEIKPVLQEVGNYDRGEGGYVFPDLSHDSETASHLKDSQNDESESVIQEEQNAVEPDPKTAEDTSETQTDILDEIITDVVDGVDKQETQAVNESHQEYADFIKEAVNNVIPPREDSGSEQLRTRRSTAAAVLEAAVNAEEALGRRELVDRFYDDDRYASKNTFWEMDIKPVLQEVGNYDHRERGYVFPDMASD